MQRGQTMIVAMVYQTLLLVEPIVVPGAAEYLCFVAAAQEELN